MRNGDSESVMAPLMVLTQQRTDLLRALSSIILLLSSIQLHCQILPAWYTSTSLDLSCTDPARRSVHRLLSKENLGTLHSNVMIPESWHTGYRRSYNNPVLTERKGLPHFRWLLTSATAGSLEMPTPDLPTELWFEILSYLPRSYVFKMMGINRVLFRMAMELKYEEVCLIADDKEALRAFKQLR